MDERWRESLWRQFGAAIEMLAQPIRDCPDDLWRARVWDHPYAELWNVACHALFWLDLYLSGAAEGFHPPAPFALDELDPEGRLPERPYTRDELLNYVEYARARCRSVIAALSDESAWRTCRFPWGEMPFAELLLYTMRHVQEHAAQLSLLLGERAVSGPGWVARAE